jgi:predicted phage-related endonuclease
MARGKEQEAIARTLYIEHTGNVVEECWFLKNGNIGYSPDGLIGDEGLLEIKSKLAHLQADILLSGEVPGEHVAQIQGGLLVSGRQWLDFVSFCPGMPLFIKRVRQDDNLIGELVSELSKFENELSETVQKIMEKF